MYIPSNINTTLVFFGICMIAIGAYILATKDVFGKGENGKMIIEALNLSEKARKIISVIEGILIILVGLFFLTNSVLYINGTYWLFRA